MTVVPGSKYSQTCDTLASCMSCAVSSCMTNIPACCTCCDYQAAHDQLGAALWYKVNKQLEKVYRKNVREAFKWTAIVL